MDQHAEEVETLILGSSHSLNSIIPRYLGENYMQDKRFYADNFCDPMSMFRMYHIYKKDFKKFNIEKRNNGIWRC